MSRGIDMATTMSGAVALVQAIAALREGPLSVYALQDLYACKRDRHFCTLPHAFDPRAAGRRASRPAARLMGRLHDANGAGISSV